MDIANFLPGEKLSLVQVTELLLVPASGEPAVVLASSVHCAVREAIRAARLEFGSSTATFQLDVPAPMTVVKELCGLDIVEKYLENQSAHQFTAGA